MSKKDILKKVRVLENQIELIENQILDALTIEQTFHGYDIEDERFRQWLSIARFYQYRKKLELDILYDEIEEYDQNISELQEKIHNLKKDNYNISRKNSSLKKMNNKIHKQREKFQNACWNIYKEIASNKSCLDSQNIIKILIDANPNYPEQYEKKYEELPSLPKKVIRKINPPQFDIVKGRIDIPLFPPHISIEKT